MSDWNSRYVCYARAHGRSPEDQMAFDGEAYPGGKMTGFTCWMSERWQEFADRNPDMAKGYTGWDRRAWLALCYAVEFDAWLEEVTSEGPAQEVR